MTTKISSDALRLAAALCLSEVLTGEELTSTIQQRIDERGLASAVNELNDRWNTRLSAGPYVLYSHARDRYWSEDHGWVVDEEAANGYSERDLRLLKAHKVCGAPDAEFQAFGTCPLLLAA